MHVLLLDVVAGSEVIGMGVLLFMVLCVLTEAVVIRLLKCTTNFGKAFLYSLIVNVITMLLGFLIVPRLEDGLLHHSSQIERVLFYFAASVVVEFFILLLLLKQVKWSRSLLTALLMNLVSYGLVAGLFIRN